MAGVLGGVSDKFRQLVRVREATSLAAKSVISGWWLVISGRGICTAACAMRVARWKCEMVGEARVLQGRSEGEISASKRTKKRAVAVKSARSWPDFHV